MWDLEVFEAKQKLLTSLGWSENPFVKDLRASDKEGFMKFYYSFEASDILKKLAFDAKACMLVGPKGVGKTSALYYVRYSLPSKEFLPMFLREPPQDLNEFAKEVGYSSSGSIFSGFFGMFSKGKKDVSRGELAEWFKKHDKKVVLFVDEAHLASKDMSMEFKYLLDDVPNLRIVFSALGKENFPDSLLQLVGESNSFQRTGFSVGEMKHIIAHRIKAVGGKGLRPFGESHLESVLSDQNLLTPRYVFDELNAFLAKLALGEARESADSEYEGDEFIKAVMKESKKRQEQAVPIPASGSAGPIQFTRSNAEWWVSLSPSQQSIMEELFKGGTGGLTLSEIMQKTQLQENTAFNALYQLRGDDEAEKKRKPDVPLPLVLVKHKLVGGRKKNIYYPNPKVKNLFTMH